MFTTRCKGLGPSPGLGASATLEGRGVGCPKGTPSTGAAHRLGVTASICFRGQKGQLGSLHPASLAPHPLQDRELWEARLPFLIRPGPDSSFSTPLPAAAALPWGRPNALTSDLGWTPPLVPPSAGREGPEREGPAGLQKAGCRELLHCPGTCLWEVKVGVDNPLQTPPHWIGPGCRPHPPLLQGLRQPI